MDSSIDALPPDLSSDFPLSSFLVDLNGQWNDALPDDDDEFCNFILEAFLAWAGFIISFVSRFIYSSFEDVVRFKVSQLLRIRLYFSLLYSFP